MRRRPKSLARRSGEDRQRSELWAARSGGKALFRMAEKVKDGMSVAEQIAAVVALP